MRKTRFSTIWPRRWGGIRRARDRSEFLMAAPFTNFGLLHQGLNPLTSLVEAGGLAETLSRPLGERIASYLSEIEIDRHPLFDVYAAPIQGKLRSPDLEERVHGL